MLIIYSVNNVPIRLTYERWEHIIFRHPEIIEEKEKIIETLRHPEVIQEGDSGTLMAIKYFQKTPLTSKYLIVVYKENNYNDGFILTAYFTNDPSAKRKIIWKP